MDEEDNTEASEYKKCDQMITNDTQNRLLHWFEVLRCPLASLIAQFRIFESCKLLIDVNCNTEKFVFIDCDYFPQAIKRRLDVISVDVVYVLIRELRDGFKDVRFAIEGFNMGAGSVNSQNEKYEETPHVEVEDNLFSVRHIFFLVGSDEIIFCLIVDYLIVKCAEISNEMGQSHPI